MNTDNIFKFVSLRPPRNPNPTIRRSYFVTSNLRDTPFQSRLKSESETREAIELAKEFMISPEYNPDTELLQNSIKSATKLATISDVNTYIENQLGDGPKALIAKPETTKLWLQLWDSLYAQVTVQDINPEDRENVYNGIRAVHYLTLVSSKEDSDKSLSWSDYLRIRPIISKDIIVKTDNDKTKSEEFDRRKNHALERFEQLHDELKTIQNSIENINQLGEIFRDQEERKTAVQSAKTNQSGNETLQPIKFTSLKTPVIKLGPSASPLKSNKSDSELAEKAGNTSVTVIVPEKKSWVFDDFGTRQLPPETKSVLAAFSSELFEKEDIEITDTLKSVMTQKVEEFFYEIPKEMESYIAIDPRLKWIANNVHFAGPSIQPVRSFSTVASPGSASFRGIKPLGVGDLLVVKQELLKYTAGEVAHIENVLKSENKTRTHKRIRESEEIVIEETDELEESERDLQTTERFELQKETQETIKSDMTVQAGLSVTASYGVVTATATGNFSFGESSSESRKNASNFAKEVIDRSVSRIHNRAREERTRRTLVRFEETNLHGFDNKEGTGHVIGIYRWVDKHYKARIVNYGRRLMFEFTVPEPASFYIHTETVRELPGVTMKEPKPPKYWGQALQPTHITKNTYLHFLAKYNARDILPPPDPIIRVSTAIAEAPGTGGVNQNVRVGTTSDKLQVPKGYKAIGIYGSAYEQGVEDTDFFLHLLIGGNEWPYVTARNIEGTIPISVNGLVTAFNVNVVAKCRLTDEAFKEWQINTYESIMNAYQDQLAEYNEQVVAAQIQHGVDIRGKNPGFNRKIEKEELRKGSLRILTNDFKRTGVEDSWLIAEEFNAMKDNRDFGYPEFNVNESLKEGKVTKFFEQVFEWHNMTYRYYPYFWGRKENWDETYSRDDIDPSFTDFLRAGSARVVVPVHPAYNEAILFYLKTNRIWNGGEPPTIDDDLHISIIDELRAELENDVGVDLPVCSDESGYPCIEDQFDIKVPTNLIYLQPDSELPDFTEAD